MRFRTPRCTPCGNRYHKTSTTQRYISRAHYMAQQTSWGKDLRGDNTCGFQLKQNVQNPWPQPRETTAMSERPTMRASKLRKPREEQRARAPHKDVGTTDTK